MKVMQWSALACASVLLVAGGLKGREAERRAAPPKPATVQVNAETAEVTLTLATLPVSAEISQGESFGVTLGGTWGNTGASPVYLQASDSAGTFVAPAPALAPKLPGYRVVLALPKSTPAGEHTGTFTVRACADSLCTQVHPGTTHSIGYTLKVNLVGEWETLQRNARHDGYVPVQIDPTRYRRAWVLEREVLGSFSAVVTDGNNVYVADDDDSPSVRALRASDGVQQWRRAFSSQMYSSLALNPPAVSNGVVYATTTGHQDTWLYGLRASDGLPVFQSKFHTQWARIPSPTLRDGKVYLNAGFGAGEVYAFDAADGTAAWQVSGGTYGMNTPAVDDNFVYAYNGSTLDVLNSSDGGPSTSIGPTPGGVQRDYYGTVMLGSADHVLAYGGTAYGANAQRQLLDYSVADGAVRWRSLSLYSNYPAVAKGVIYATSNETHTLDALDETTGRLLWSWKPAEQGFDFVYNVVVTDNVVFVSTKTRIYAISLRHHRTVWSEPTPGSMSVSANRMLFVASPYTNEYPFPNGRITAYRLD